MQRSALGMEDAAKTKSGVYWSIYFSVGRALLMLGDSGKDATLKYLAMAGIPEEEIPLRLDLFVRTLRDLFGAGAAIIEFEVVKNIRLMEYLTSNDTTIAGVLTELNQRGKWP